MENEEIIKYIMAQDVVDVPTLQKQFSLSYAEAKAIINDMLESKMLEYVSGVDYKVLVKNDSQTGERMIVYENNPEKLIYKQVLWECIKRNTVSIAAIRFNLGLDTKVAGRAFEWMEQNCYFTNYPEKRIMITEKEYKHIFGNPNKPFKLINETMPQALYLACSRPDDFKIDDCDDVDVSKNEGDVGGVDEAEKIRETMTKLNELMTSMSEEIDKKEDPDIKTFKEGSDTYSEDLQAMLASCFLSGVREKEQGKEYAIAIDGDKEFGIKFVNDGNAVKLSDGGYALSKNKKPKKRIKLLLKNYVAVKLEGNEIVVEVAQPSDALKALMVLYAAVDAVTKI